MRNARRNIHDLSEVDHATLARMVMKRQAALSLQVAAVFVVLVFGLPLFNFYRPDLANRPLFGFTASWLFLGILFFPITWLLSAYFIRQSDRIESECSDWRVILGEQAGEPIEPEGIDEVRPAFIAEDLEERP